MTDPLQALVLVIIVSALMLIGYHADAFTRRSCDKRRKK